VSDESDRGDWLFAGVVVTSTLLAAAWGALMYAGHFFIASFVGLPVAMSWYLLFTERGFGQ